MVTLCLVFQNQPVTWPQGLYVYAWHRGIHVGLHDPSSCANKLCLGSAVTFPMVCSVCVLHPSVDIPTCHWCNLHLASTNLQHRFLVTGLLVVGRSDMLGMSVSSYRILNVIQQVHMTR